MADRVTFRLRGVNRRRDDDDGTEAHREMRRILHANQVQNEGFVDVRPGHLNPRFFNQVQNEGFAAANARLRQAHREYLENTGNRSYTGGVYSWPVATVRDSNYYRQLWTRIAADWRFFAAQDFVNTFGTMVYLPLRRAVRGFTRRWRARNQWRMNIAGIPVAGRVWDANNPPLFVLANDAVLGRRPLGGESGLI